MQLETGVLKMQSGLGSKPQKEVRIPGPALYNKDRPVAKWKKRLLKKAWQRALPKEDQKW